MDFLDILLEAKGNKPRARTLRVNQKQIQQDSTDYTDEESADDDTGTLENDDQDTDASDTENEDNATDYTEEEVDVDPEENGETTDGDDEDTDDATDNETDDGTGDINTDDATDYTDESGDETDVGEDTGEESSGETTEEQPAEDENEIEKQRILLADFTNLFYLTKNTIAKLSSINNSNIFVNKIISQITSNLNILKKYLFDYIVFSFSKEKYVTNLYKYNYFLEAFKINVQMLKKISVFIPN